MDAATKAGLLDLLEEALDAGWTLRRACRVLELPERRAHRWIGRRARGQLADLAPGGAPMHGLLADEVAQILALFDQWGETDRSHRKLATCRCTARGLDRGPRLSSVAQLCLTEKVRPHDSNVDGPPVGVTGLPQRLRAKHARSARSCFGITDGPPQVPSSARARVTADEMTCIGARLV